MTRGERFQERCNDRQDVQPTEGDRRGDGELALRLVLFARNTQARRIELGKDAAAGLQDSCGRSR